MPKSKNSFFLNFLLLGSIYVPILENFIKRFGFCQFSSFLVNFGCFFGQKKPKSKNSFFIEFYFVARHLHTKFQKILSNGLDSVNFLHFWSILDVFLAKKCQIRKIVFS
jgi:hypothetical protein